MSTEIKSTFGRVRLHADSTRVGVATTDQHGAYGIMRSLPRADFLAAVQSELGVRLVPDDAIVIEQKDAATRAEIADAIHRETSYSTASDHDCRIVARAVDAIYNALSKPSVDEAQAQVQALARALGAEGLLSQPFSDIAADLYHAGVRIEVKP